MAIMGSIKAEAKLFAQFQDGDMIELGVFQIDIPIHVSAIASTADAPPSAYEDGRETHYVENRPKDQ